MNQQSEEKKSMDMNSFPNEAWEKETRNSPILELLCERSNAVPIWRRPEPLSLIVVSTLGLIAAISQIFLPSSPRLLMSLGVGYVIAAGLQIIYVWIRPKRDWENLLETGEVTKHLSTSSHPGAILGPFVLLARKAVHISFIFFFALCALGITLAKFHEITSLSYLWFAAIGACVFVAMVFQPATLILESVYWWMYFKGFSRVISSLVCSILFLCFVSAFSFFLMKSFDYTGIDSLPSMQFLLAALVLILVIVALFWMLGLTVVTRLFTAHEDKIVESLRSVDN